MSSMLGIGEFATTAGLSVSAVRFYADRGLLTPANVDPTTGYRSFHPEQVSDARLIRDLRLIGMPLAEVTSALKLSPAEITSRVDAHIDGLEVAVNDARAIAHRLGASPDVPDSAEPQAPATSIQATELAAAITQVLPFASTDGDYPELMTVLVESKAGSLRLVATDRHRLAIRDLVPALPGADFTTLIAGTAAKRFANEVTPDEELSIRLDHDGLVVSGPLTDRRLRTVSADFPDYEQFLTPPANSTSILVDRRKFLTALEPFADGGGGVLLNFEDNQLRLERRAITVDVAIASAGTDVYVAFDPDYAMECAASALGPELVLEIQHDPLEPMIIRSAAAGTFVSLLMPIKLD